MTCFGRPSGLRYCIAVSRNASRCFAAMRWLVSDRNVFLCAYASIVGNKYQR